MTYLVNPLPKSILNYVFYFKSLEDEDIKKYIESIIGEEFHKGESDESQDSFFRKKAIDAIYYSHKFVRENNGVSSVSLRDLQRFRRTYKFFLDYYQKKYDFLISNGIKLSEKAQIKAKIQSFALALFITYDIKIFKYGLNSEYLSKINVYIKDLADKFQIKEWIETDSSIFPQVNLII